MSPAADQKARPETRRELRFPAALGPAGADGGCGTPGAGPAAAMAALRDPGGLAAIREQVRRIEQGRRLGRARPVAPLGLAALDDALPGGGLPLGALHEIEGERAEWDDGATLGFCLALLARLEKAAPTTRRILWVSRQGDLYPPALAGQGLDPGRFLLVRAKSDAEVLWALEEGLRCRRLAAVVGEVEGLDRLAGRRLQLAAEASLDEQGSGTSAVTAFALHRRFRPPSAGRAPSAALSRWQVTAATSGDERGESFIGRPRWRLDLLRCRGAAPGTWQVEWDDAACGFSLAPALRDRPLAAAARPGPAAAGPRPVGELVGFRQAG